MADKLIFPIGFDLEAGMNEAVKNIDATLIRIERRIKDKPLELNISGLSELDQSIKTLTESLTRLNAMFAATANMQHQLTNSTQEQEKTTTNTSNTISRQLMEQERLNKALRDVYSEQERVNALLDRYHDTYDEQVGSLIRLNNALEANKQAQKDNEKALKDHSITSAEFNAKQKELTAQYRQLTQEKRTLNQIMTAEEKAMQTQEGSYVQLSQQLSLLKKAYKELGEEGRTSVFGQDLEGAIQNLDARLKDMAADMGEFQRNVGNYAIAGQNGVVTTESLAAAINQEARTTQDLIDQTRILEEAKKMLNTSDANYASTLDAINAKLEENKHKLSDISDILGRDAKSVAEAEAQNKRLSEALKLVDLTSEDAKKRLEEIRTQIERNNKTIADATGANEKYAGSLLGLIGVNANFGTSLQSLGSGGNFIDGLKTKVQAFGKTLMGLLSNPVVLGFLGIAGVVAGFKWWYDYNKGLIEASRLTENFTGLSGEAADKVTADMQALADHMGQGYDKTISAANVLVQQFGISWDQAMKLMQDGIAAGADMSGNMVSNIERYAPALRDAGVSADEFMSILAETRNGIFNERGMQLIVRAGGRLKAMTNQMAASLDAAGISSKQLQKDLTDGTITMFDAVQQVATKLKELPENSQEAGNIMKYVFGRTAAEGGTLLIRSIADVNTNLDEAKKRMKELGKANEEQINAQKELNEALMAVFKMSGTSFEIMIINAKTFVTQGLTAIIRGCVDIVNWFINIYNEASYVRKGVAGVVGTFKSLWTVAKGLFELLINGFEGVGGVLEGVALIFSGKFEEGATRMKDAIANGLKGVKDIVIKSGKEIGANFSDEFKNIADRRLTNVSIKLDSDISGGGKNDEDGNTGSGVPIGSKVDKEAAKTYLQTLNKIEQSLSSIYSKYGDLEKKEGATKALEHINELYKTQLDYINELGKQFGLSFKMPTSFKDLQSYRSVILDVINKLKASGIKGADEAALDLEMKIGLGNISEQSKQIESELKRLADRISRTKTAKEFYEKILSQTGDVELATRVSLSIYGSTGEELFEDTVKQIREVFKSGKEDVVIDLAPVFDMSNQRIDYKMLADIYEKYQDSLIAANKETAKKIAQEGQKEVAANIANWQKELAKAKDFEQQRTDIIRTAATEREKIIKEVRDPKEREELLNLSREKESQDLAKVNFEEFTKSEDYIKIFENLDNVATSSLKRLRAEMQALIDTNQNLSPENMKTLVKAMEDIDEQISGRGFGNDMIQSVNDYIASIKNLKTAKQELAKAEAEYQAQEPRLDADIETAKTEKESADKDVVTAQQELLGIQTQMAALREQEIIDETQLAALQAQEVVASNALTAAELKQNQASKAVVNAEQAKTKAANKVKKAEQKVSGEQDKQKEATTKFFKDLQQVAATADQLASVLGDVQEALGISEDSAAGLVFDSAIQGLQEFSKIMNVIIGLQTLYNIVTSSNPWLAIAAAVLAVGSILGSLISGSKVRKANKEIERQQELLDQLEYTYGRLEKAAEKVFGADYLRNHNRQLEALQAEAEAKRKQAEAERSKGKKEDEEKTKQYLEEQREILDQIADMEGQVAERMLGTDLTSAARDFANAWLEAYKEFSNTADAMSEKFHEMVENMIVEGLLAKVMERALKPAFDMIDNMNEEDFYSESFWKKVMATAEQGAKDADHGAGVVMSWIEKMGINMRELDSEYTGIAKNIAGATSEEINAVAAIGNTVMYHTSHLPIISQNVAAMYELMSQGKASPLPDSGAAGWTDWQQQAMENYNAIARNTADTVVECRRAAVACEAATEKLNRIIVAKGGKFAVNTTYI